MSPPHVNVALPTALRAWGVIWMVDWTEAPLAIVAALMGRSVGVVAPIDPSDELTHTIFLFSIGLD